VFRNAILCWVSFKKRLCRGIVFKVSIQEVQRVERNRGMTRVGVIPSRIGYLIFRKALRTLPALKHRTEFWVCHAQHIHGEEIAVDPGVQDAWTHYVCRGTNMIFVKIFQKVRICCEPQALRAPSHCLRKQQSSRNRKALPSRQTRFFRSFQTEVALRNAAPCFRANLVGRLET
jgi:hypothetical protein